MTNHRSPKPKLVEIIVYYFKYLVYLLNLLVYKIRISSTVSRFGALNLLTKTVLVCVAIFAIAGLSLLLPKASRSPLEVKPIRLQKTNTQSPYLYTGSNQDLTISLGDKKSGLPQIEVTSKKGGAATFVLSGSQKSEPKTSTNSISYQNTQENLDLRYTTLPNGLKEEIILKSPPKTNKFYFDLNLSGVLPKKYTDTVYAPVFYNSKGEVAFQMEKPFATDAQGNITYASLLQLKDTDIPGKYLMELIVDEAWLYNPNRQYPVIIDPTVTYDTSTTYSTGQFNRTVDTGSGSNPNITTAYKELTNDAYTTGLWHLNETSGSLLDSSEYANHATYNGTTVVAGPDGLSNARRLNGSGDYITAESAPASLVTDFTLEGWYRNEGTNGIQTPGVLIQRGDNTTGYGILIGSNTGGSGSALNSWYGSGGYNCNVNYNGPNIWHHVALVRDKLTAKCYLDGDLKSIYYTNTPATIANTRVSIGAQYNTTNTNFEYFFKGSLDEIRISNRARTADEIRSDASRYFSGSFTSNVIVVGLSSKNFSLSWLENGVKQGGGESPYSSTGLVGQWNFNESSGTTATVTNTSTGCNYTCNGTLTNFASTTSRDQTPLSGWTANNKLWGAGALTFDGTDDSVEVADNDYLDVTSAITLEAWAKFTNTTSTQNNMIMAKGAGADGTGMSYELNINTAYYTPEMRLHNGSTMTSLFSDTSIIPDVWTHVVGTWDGSTMKIYVNGVLQGQKSFAGPIRAGTEPLVFGRRKTGSSTYQAGYNFNGTIDSPRIYNRALSQGEIVANYNSANLEIQTRSGNTLNPDDGTWSPWTPTNTETQLLSLDADSANWTWENTAGNTHKTQADDTTFKIEGSGSLKLTYGSISNVANTVALWHLDETSGTSAFLKDSSTTAGHGTPNGTTTIKGITSQARHFNGTSDYIATTNPGVTGSGNRTFEGWIRLYPKSGDHDIAYWGDESAAGKRYEIKTNAGALQVKVNGGQSAGTTNIIDGKWHHIAVVQNGTNATNIALYVDGLAETVTTTSQAINTGTSTVRLGYDPVGNGSFMFGDLDEVRILNTTRTADQIAETYRNGRDHYANRTIASTNLSNQNTLQFNIASNRPGQVIQTIIGESSFSNYQPDASTLALWHLDESTYYSSSIKDAAASFNGTITGTTIYPLKGVLGGAQQITTNGAFVALGNIALVDNRANLTIDAWIWPMGGSASTYYTVYAETINVVLCTYGQQACIRFGNGTSYTLNELAGGTVYFSRWNHLALVKSGTNYSVYVNGRLTKTGTTAPATTSTTTKNNYIGSLDGTTTGGFLGAIDEVRVSSVARTAAEIRDAYEVGSRTHTTTIDFAAKLDSSNLITDVNDTSFNINATLYGLTNKGSAIFPGETIVIQENYNGTTFTAQGTVNAVNSSNGDITVNSWNAGSTVPSVGFSVNADVFKWQKESFNLGLINSTSDDAITNLSVKLVGGHEGKNVWIDDLRYSGDYLTNPTESAFTFPIDQQYLQYRVLLNSSSPFVSSTLLSPLTINYTRPPLPPTATSSSAISTNSITWNWTDNSPSSTQGYAIFDENNNQIASWSGKLNNSYTENGLNPDTLYIRKMVAWSGDGVSSYSSSTATSTLATPPTITSITRSKVTKGSSATIQLQPSNNPADTLYSIYVVGGTNINCNSAGGKYVSIDGVLYNSLQWVTMTNNQITVSGLESDVLYLFCVKAKNRAGILTDSYSGNDNTGILPRSGDATITVSQDSACINPTIDGDNPTRNICGIDSGVTNSSTNSSKLTISNNATITISSNQTLAVGSITLINGSIALANGGEIILGKRLYYYDAKGDGYSPEPNVTYLNPDTNLHPRTELKDSNAIDCNDSISKDTNSCTTVYPDRDNDGYGDHLNNGSSSCTPDVTGKCQIDGVKYITNKDDCNDSSNLVYNSLSGCYIDADADGYGVGNHPGSNYCSNYKSCATTTIYSLIQTSEADTPFVNQNSHLSSNNSDCLDTGTNSNQVMTSATCYLDSDNDDYGDWNSSAYNCIGPSGVTACSTATSGAKSAINDSVLISTNFSSNNTDCGNNSASAYPGSNYCGSGSFNYQGTATQSYDYNCDNSNSTCGTIYTYSATGNSVNYAATGGSCSNCNSNCKTLSNTIYSTQTTSCGSQGAICTATNGKSGGSCSCKVNVCCSGASDDCSTKGVTTSLCSAVTTGTQTCQ